MPPGTEGHMAAGSMPIFSTFRTALSAATPFWAPVLPEAASIP